VSIQYYMRGRETGPSDIFIATTSGSTPKPNYVDSMARTIKEFARVGIEADWLLHHGDPHVDDGRNACVAQFLESGAPRFLFIDDDVGWVAEELVKFIKHDRDVVAAIYPKKTDNPDWPVRLLPGPLQAEEDGLLQVENVPTGFLLIKRHVLETMAADAVWFKRKDSGQTPLLFERGVTGDLRWSGDYWWGRKWTERGGTIWIDPEINLSHVGLKTWRGCIGDFWRDQSGILDPMMVKTFGLLRDGVVRPEIWEVLSGRSGNYPFCAPDLMMAACWEMAKAVKGPVLEIGSGLTTTIMGIAGAEVHTLEHDLGWLHKSRKWVKRFGLANVHLHYAPLREYPDGTAWYEIPAGLPASFDLLVCDGPPRKYTDRKALWRLLPDAIKDADWIVDDVDGDVSFYEQGGRKAEISERFAVIRRVRDAV
jgi:hypothetical protein